MGLWNSNANTPPAPSAPSPARTFTNAPRHWPAVSFAATKPGADQFFTIVGALSEPLQKLGARVHVMRTYIYDDGLLEVPLVVEENGATTCVLYYPNAGPDAAAHYTSVRQLLKTREGAAAVFYSPEPIGQAPPRPVLGALDPRQFTKPSEPPSDARYALWWPTPEDPSFTTSEDRVLIDRWFEALHGYAHVLLSTFVNELHLVEPTDGRPQLVGLPEDAFSLQLLGHGGVPLALRASVAEGVVLSFDTAAVSATQRRTYLYLLVQLAEGCRARAITERRRADADDLSLATWHAVRDEALEAEAAGQRAEDLYVVAIADGTVLGDAPIPPPLPPPAPPPLPRSEAGGTAPALPSHDALSFAIGLIQTAAANLKDRPVAASSDDRLGQSNLAPVIVAKADGRVWRRVLAGDDGERPVREAARAREEWPEASLVAVLMDGAIREGDTRVDVLRVLLQEGQVAASVFWRYATVGEGALELYGRPTVMPAAPFVDPPEPPPIIPGGFDASLFALASQAFAHTQRFTEPGAESDRASRLREWPIEMPYALLWDVAETPTMCAFAMQGPVAARESCRALLATNAKANAVAFAFDDIVDVDRVAHRRLRVYVQRRGMPAAAIVERRFDLPRGGASFTFSGEPVFVRWTESLFD
jgi:hypothetical protein